MDVPNTYRPSPAPTCTKVAFVVYLCLLVGFTAFYIATAQRDVSWQDSGMFQYRILHRDYAGDLGLALAHPMCILMQQAVVYLAPGHVFWAINAFSGLGMAVALANLSLLVHRLTGRWWAGVGIAAILSVAHTVWWLSTIAEVYTWSLAGLSLECLLLVSLIRRPHWGTLVGLALVSGWGWSLHDFALLPLPVHLTVIVYLMIRRRLPVWNVLPAMAAYGLGAGMYLGMIVAYTGQAGGLAAMRSALFGDYYTAQVLGGGSWHYLPYNLGLLALNGVSLMPLLAVLGWRAFRRRLGGETALALAAITVIHVVFVLRYPVPDQFTFGLPALWMTALAGGVGLAVLAERSPRWRVVAGMGVLVSIVAGPAAYALIPRLAGDLTFANRTQRPFRNEVRYWVTPWKHNEHSADQFAQAVWQQLQPVRDAGNEPILLLDSTALYPVLLTQDAQPYGPQIQIQQDNRPLPLSQEASVVRHAAGTRPLYILSPTIIPRSLRDATTAVKEHEGDVLYRLHWNDEAMDH